MNRLSFLLTLALLAAAPLARADDAPLDSPYPRLRHPRVELSLRGRDGPNALPARSELLSVLARQSTVKAQAARGACSIFSATALLESHLIARGLAPADVDLSEEWLQLVIAQTAYGEGSTSPRNFSALRQWGSPAEASLPYVGALWKDALAGEPAARCGHLESTALKRCLVGHRDVALLTATDEELIAGPRPDPELLAARREAAANRARWFGEGAPAQEDGGWFDEGIVAETREVKQRLAAGEPLTLDLTFYYGAWNHRLTAELGIPRDLALWEQGVVTYPERGSLDADKSWQKPAGHSVLIVGYDDERELEYSLKMTTGETKTFRRKGVYYFKNSWGTEGFGARFSFGEQKFPGYGMISQDYAHEHGQFFRLRWN